MGASWTKGSARQAAMTATQVPSVGLDPCPEGRWEKALLVCADQTCDAAASITRDTFLLLPRVPAPPPTYPTSHLLELPEGGAHLGLAVPADRRPSLRSPMVVGELAALPQMIIQFPALVDVGAQAGSQVHGQCAPMPSALPQSAQVLGCQFG